jgi:predicted acetyltransferase
VRSQGGGGTWRHRNPVAPAAGNGYTGGMADVVLRPIDRTEFPAFYRCLIENFGDDPRDSDRDADLLVFEPDRSTAGFDGDRLVATAGILTRDMTLPGGPKPIAAVTLVSVAPTHRRRGVLTEIMRRQLTELYEDQREPVAALWASEGRIYGRFGYGLAVRRAALSGRTQEMELRPGVDVGTGQMRLATAEQARPQLAEVYEQVRGSQVGWLDRRGPWWDQRLLDPEHWRDGATAMRYALNTEEDGRVTGYVAYRIKQSAEAGRNDNEVQVLELTATTPQSYAAVWSFVTSLDLMRVLRKRVAPLDEPFQHQLADPRALRMEAIDGLWVRLADVGRALADRRYTTELDVVLEVTDDFCPWNAGRWRLRGGADGASCSRTGDAADLAVSTADLGAAYLGGTRLAALALAGRVGELRPGALAVANRAFAADHEPWCPEVF